MDCYLLLQISTLLGLHNCPFFLRDNNFIKDFPQLADGLMVIPLPVEEQCRGVLSEPLPNLQLLTGECLHGRFMDMCFFFSPGWSLLLRAHLIHCIFQRQLYYLSRIQSWFMA